MKLKLFTLPFLPEKGCFDDTAMKAFLSDKDVFTVYPNAFTVGDRPFWALLVKYDGKTGESVTRPLANETNDSNKPIADSSLHAKSPSFSTNELSDDQKNLFEAMRTWRYKRAHDAGFPPYYICTNKELEMIVKAKPTDLASFSAINGVKKSVIEKFGLDILKALKEVN